MVACSGVLLVKVLLFFLHVSQGSDEVDHEAQEMALALQLEEEVYPEGGSNRREVGAHFYRSNMDAWRFPGQYVVVLKPNTDKSHTQRTIRRLQAKAAKHGYLTDVIHIFHAAFQGFAIKMSSDVLDLALKLPHVDFIEEDSYVFAQSVPWNLNRIVPVQHVTGHFKPPNNGDQVEVYLLDTSIQSNHRELDGRILVTDFENIPEEDGTRFHRQAGKCNSHATHTAGVVNGRDSGIARGANVRSLRVLNCQGKGTVSGSLAALEFIQNTLNEQPYSPLIILLPFTGGHSNILNMACRTMSHKGVVMITAAGNYKDDACLYSPASEPEVITVAATNYEDQPASMGHLGTNFGHCVDIFAPGDDIVSASSDCTTCFTSQSGTSQAAAHVAGIAAVILNSNKSMTVSDVRQRLIHFSSKHLMNKALFPEDQRLITPNRVVALPSKIVEEELLFCRTVWSKRSGLSRTAIATAHCNEKEEMFSCSSYSENDKRRGEHIEHHGGKKMCTAHNAFGGQGVYAVARCCIWPKADCHTNSTASAEDAVEADIGCSKEDHILTGCSSYSTTGQLTDSVKPLSEKWNENTTCSGRKDATTHASCCHAPSLECQVKEHASVGFTEKVVVSCDDGWTVTGCHPYSRGFSTHGAYIEDNTCIVTSSRGGKGAAAVAICCRSKHSSFHGYNSNYK
ncbi:proprotein convertase subtilisin/kexin type 9 [Protopterus annectens]|uniref:proprotein convertase subtilisin/kexin type 9 n=1 Tax=Protopterus annectens TaxID=7888 RepID=UPI001CF9D5CE|nr:proprotein convertase subtilisin/kexin type 9 [Protopterus annectens]